MNEKLIHWIQAACIAAMLAGVAVPVRAGVSDAWISTKVKMRLMNSTHVAGLPIDVDTDEGRVTLHGKVASQAEKLAAGRIAATGTGVVAVRNLVQVVPASRRRSVEVADGQLERDVDLALKGEPGLANSSVHAKSVNKGVVLLAGEAATLSDHLLALETAADVPGVRQVASEVQSPDEFGDREIWYDEQPADPARGNIVTDGWITAQTKMRFMTDVEVPAGDIHVDTRRGVVTLFGTTSSASTSDRAVRLAKEIAGVESVRSELRVVVASRRKLATANDGQIESAVRRRISDARLEGADVHVDVVAATARLSGTVLQAAQRYAVVSIAHATPGVVRVQNDLRVENAQTSAR